MKKPFLLILLLLVRLPTHASAATVAISHSSSTICVINRREKTQTITCARPNSGNFSVDRPYSFRSISGGRDYICGLRSSETAIFCFDLASHITSSSKLQPKRIYNSVTKKVSNLAVGENHVAGILAGKKVNFWRDKDRFPPTNESQYKSLTSGNRFTCAIEKNSNSVKCWGSDDLAEKLEEDFSEKKMKSISAGDSMLCGVTISGCLICGGNNTSLPPSGYSPNELSSPAVGKTHVCALWANGSAVCWREGNPHVAYGPKGRPNNTSFEFLVAGGNLTCGLYSTGQLLCWQLDGLPLDLQLPKAIPGSCFESCKCQHVADSATLCGGSKSICKPCEGPPPAPPPCEGPPPPTPKGNDGKSNGVKDKLLLAFGVVGSFAGLCSIIYCASVGLFRRKKKVHNSVLPTVTRSAREPTSSPPAAPTNSFGSTIMPFKSRSTASSLFGRRIQRQRSGPSSTKVPDRAEEFTFFELSLATDNFSPSARIGWGSFGSVYRGKLLDGREVAVKRSESGVRSTSVAEKESEFYSELAFLSRLHHKHLVALLGFSEDRGEQLLVYDYMNNGSLYDHLHPKSTAESSSPSSNSPLHASWRLRIKLLLDAARGIEYLHDYAVPPIIHRDIKSSNILIDGTWTARISDFGLSLNHGSPETWDVDGGGANRKKAGTVGYMDPEYYRLHQLTTKSDVYGFGVVMLEVLTGRKAIFKTEGEELINVVDYAWESVRAGEVGRVLDRRVAGERPATEAEAVELVAYTAISCVTLISTERPTMKGVVSNLEVALSLCEQVASGSNSVVEGSSE